jgi:predicted transcriptional regulator of viral defense system
MDNLITKLYKTPKNILTNKDLSLIWQEKNADNLYSKTNYYAKQGNLIRLSRGIFAKDKNYNPKELATSIYSPSYVSFETALREAGIIFQYYETIFIASKWTKKLTIDNNSISFRKMKDSILYNPKGITQTDNYSIATPERAFLDMIYLFPNYYFDNLKFLNWEKCFELVKIYNNKQLEKRLIKYQKNAK